MEFGDSDLKNPDRVCPFAKLMDNFLLPAVEGGRLQGALIICTYNVQL
jgi:hypothetical protein